MALPDDIRQTKRITTHPGEMLAEEFLVPLKMSASALAAEIGVPANRLTEMVAGRRNMTADTALRLADRAYVYEAGEIVLQGTGAEWQAHPEVSKAYLGY